MTHGVPDIRRLWGVIRDSAPGRSELVLTGREPSAADVAGTRGALLLTGMLAGDDLTLSLAIVSNPKADPELTGPSGPNGWTPILAAEQDGTRTLFRIVGWKRSAGEPGAGYLTATGDLTANKASAFNFNAAKRVDIFSATSAATGIATIAFDPAFAGAPTKVLPMATPNLLAGPVKAELVAGSVTKTGCQVKVTQQSLVGGVVSVLAGASVQVIAIEG